MKAEQLYKKPTKFGPRIQYEDHLLTDRTDMDEFHPNPTFNVDLRSKSSRNKHESFFSNTFHNLLTIVGTVNFDNEESEKKENSFYENEKRETQDFRKENYSLVEDHIQKMDRKIRGSRSPSPTGPKLMHRNPLFKRSSSRQQESFFSNPMNDSQVIN